MIFTYKSESSNKPKRFVEILICNCYKAVLKKIVQFKPHLLKLSIDLKLFEVVL